VGHGQDVRGILCHGPADCNPAVTLTNYWHARVVGVLNLLMSQKQLASAIDQRFRSMNRRERIAKIRKLAGASPEDDRFIRKTFPELYREASQATRRGVGVRSGAVRKRGRAARLRSR